MDFTLPGSQSLQQWRGQRRRGQGNAKFKTEKIIPYPRFHLQKLRVVKTHRKIQGSNDYWWFINSHPGDPTLLRWLLMEDLDGAQKYHSAAGNRPPRTSSIFFFHNTSSTFLSLSFFQMPTPITWIRFYGYPLFFFPASGTAWGKSQTHWRNSQDAHQDRNHQAQL